ncbi:MAG: ATP-binding protein [Planctomycetota bacterium]|jgi:anti-sigma regulatory factor (Ser/Thr protein kinase)
MADGWQGIRISLTSDARYLEALRAVIREATGLAGLTEDDLSDVQLAVTEGCANVIRHCYHGCPDERIDVVLTFGEDRFEVRIDDYGKFVDPKHIKGRDLDDLKPGGLGVHLMRRAMDEVIYEKNGWGGTTLILRKRVRRMQEEREDSNA